MRKGVIMSVNTYLNGQLIKVGGTDVDSFNQCQMQVLPTPSSIYENKIYQFVGSTTESYINGYFYKCVSNGE